MLSPVCEASQRLQVLPTNLSSLQGLHATTCICRSSGVGGGDRRKARLHTACFTATFINPDEHHLPAPPLTGQGRARKASDPVACSMGSCFVRTSEVSPSEHAWEGRPFRKRAG